jgi:hypothetical protein
MMKRNLLPRAVLVAILLALPAAANAPRNPPQYAQFLSDSATIKDNRTLLEWDRRSIMTVGASSSYGNGQTLCKTLPAFLATPPKNGGRLPTIKELLTLLDEEPHNEYEFGAVVPKMIDQLAFDGTPVDLPYWSSSPAEGGLFWTLDFKNGLMVALPPAGPANVRCVR